MTRSFRHLAIGQIALLVLSTVLLPQPVVALEYGMDSSLFEIDGSFWGEADDDGLGRSVAGVGDVNGDGFDDLLIAAPGWVSIFPAGKAYLVFGNESGWALNQSIADADVVFLGEAGGDRAGWKVAAAGDVDADGYDDMLIAAPFSDQGGSDAGQVYLILGKAAGWGASVSLADADASFVGENVDDWAGRGLSGAGDVNGDGFDDFLIGAPWNDEAGGEPTTLDDGAGQTYLILGKEDGWAMRTPLSQADGSFQGMWQQEAAGTAVGGGGDINGDGFDDILIGAPTGYGGWGRVYVYYGKADGWQQDVTAWFTDASFVAEGVNDQLGTALSIAPDVNGDGIDDVLLGSPGNKTNGDWAGKAYLILGQEQDYGHNVSVSTADASWLGESASDNAGEPPVGVGDVDGDGYGDIMISSHRNTEGGSNAGQVYLILGRAAGWTTDTDLSLSDASFFPGSFGGYAGLGASGAGDADGDGNADLLIGAPERDDGGTDDGGAAYVVFPKHNDGPIDTTTLRLYSDASYSSETATGSWGQTIYVELQGIDGNATTIDLALANVTSDQSSPLGFRLALRETGADTAVYQGSFKLYHRTDQSDSLIDAGPGEVVTLTSVRNGTISDSLTVLGGVTIEPALDQTSTIEDEAYLVNYTALPPQPITWDIQTDASWLSWNTTTQALAGTPDNGDVGTYSVSVRADGLLGFSDEHQFELEVVNAPPQITTFEFLIPTEDVPWWIDYNSTDDGQGTITWHLQGQSTAWLTIDPQSGILNGTPTNDQVPQQDINVGVDDGNGGWDWSNVTLPINNVNDAPSIFGDDQTTVKEGEEYEVDYDVVDEDISDDSFLWVLQTTAPFLVLDNWTGILSGYPQEHDIGTYEVNITVFDLGDASASRNFTLEVLDSNNVPFFVSTPMNQEVFDGSVFSAVLEATDGDPWDRLTFNVSTIPPSDMSVEPQSGELLWNVTRQGLGSVRPYVLQVTVNVSDGKAHSTHGFNLTVIKPAPILDLVAPPDGSTVIAASPTLKWDGSDAWNERLVYSLYVGADASLVQARDGSTLQAQGLEEREHTVPDLTAGTTYSWLVVVTDGSTNGTSAAGPWSFLFQPNTPPTIEAVPDQQATVGRTFSLQLIGADVDPGDTVRLRFTLTGGAPSGLTIDETSGKLQWKPHSGQTGNHVVTVSLSDGKSSTEVSFTITVQQDVEVATASSPLLIALVLLAVVGLVIALLLMRRRGGRGERLTPTHQPAVSRPMEPPPQGYSPPAPPPDQSVPPPEVRPPY